jgi:DNA polymerase-1
MHHLIIDGNSIAHWRYYASPLEKDERGREVGMLRSFERWLDEVTRSMEATDVTVCFDAKRNWRYELLPSYKGQRSEKPPELVAQLSALPKWLEDRFHRGTIGQMWKEDGYEADDLCAAEVVRLPPGRRATVISGDKDLCQLVDDEAGVRVFSPRPGEMYNASAVVEKFGVPPYRLREYLALCGDTADNVKGVPGWGPKKAVAAISETIDWEHLLERARRLELSGVPVRLQKTLNEHVEALRLCYDVVGFRHPPSR